MSIGNNIHDIRNDYQSIRNQWKKRNDLIFGYKTKIFQQEKFFLVEKDPIPPNTIYPPTEYDTAVRQGVFGRLHAR